MTRFAALGGLVDLALEVVLHCGERLLDQVFELVTKPFHIETAGLIATRTNDLSFAVLVAFCIVACVYVDAIFTLFCFEAARHGRVRKLLQSVMKVSFVFTERIDCQT
jgi:hypothetical protein